MPMNKVNYLLSIAALGMTAACDSNEATKQDEIEQPNIVFILADDMGWGDVGCFGQDVIETPNIDSLASQGIRFTRSYSGATVSAPSRTNLMTGLHGGHAPIRGNFEIMPEGQMAMPKDTYTLFKMFKDAGYTTGAFGKWGLGSPGSEGAPENQYVDEFFGYNCQRMSHTYYPEHLYHNGEKITLHGNLDGGFGCYAPDTIQERALAFIEKNKDKPFFLFIPSILPHAELAVPDDTILHKYLGRFEETPYHGCDTGCHVFRIGGYASQDHPRATYAAMVSRFDAHVGQIINKLKESGIYGNTLIIVSSDNGPHEEGGNDPIFFSSSGPFRGMKRDLYEGGIRVPTVAVWEGHIEANTTSALRFAFWDYMPTFAEIIGIEPPPCDGISIMPTLLGESQKEHDYLYFEFQERNGRQCVIKDGWKLIKLNVATEPIYELYHIDTDSTERNNLIDREKLRAEELMNIMQAARTADENWNFK